MAWSVEKVSCVREYITLQGSLQRVTICDGARSITHLLFADDSLFLLKVNDENAHHLWHILQLYEELLLLKVNDKNAHHLWHILQLYEECLGQAINRNKSLVMFSKNTNDTTSNFMDILEMGQTEAQGKYLDLLVYMGRSKAKMFICIRIECENVFKDEQKKKMLSRAGKEV